MAHIAYLNGYQGPDLIRQRSIKRNLALASSRKILQITRLLVNSGHNPVIISEAYTAERSKRIFSRCTEKIGSLGDVPVYYAASIDIRFLCILIGFIDVLCILLSQHRRQRFDCVIIYNFSIFQFVYIFVAKFLLRIPVFLDYEDDAVVGRFGEMSFISFLSLISGKIARQWISGCFAVTPRLLNQVAHPNSFLLRGFVTEEVSKVSESLDRSNIVLYTGSMDKSKGVDHLVKAWKMLPRELEWTLVITGDGEMAQDVIDAQKVCPSIQYKGIVPFECIIGFLKISRIGINPHRMTSNYGNIFPFKVIEYLAAGLIVVSTPMIEIEKELQKNIRFTKSDSAEDIASSLYSLLLSPPEPQRIVSDTATNLFGEQSVSKKLELMLKKGGVCK